MTLPARAEAAPAQAPSLTVAPLPKEGQPSSGVPVVRWATGTPAGEVTVTDESGEERLFSNATQGAEQAPWIDPGRRYTFRLYTTTPARKQLKIFSIGAPLAVGTPVSTDQEPASSNRTLDALPFVFVSLVVLLCIAGAYVKTRWL